MQLGHALHPCDVRRIVGTHTPSHAMRLKQTERAFEFLFSSVSKPYPAPPDLKHGIAFLGATGHIRNNHVWEDVIAVLQKNPCQPIGAEAVFIQKSLDTSKIHVLLTGVRLDFSNAHDIADGEPHFAAKYRCSFSCDRCQSYHRGIGWSWVDQFLEGSR